MFGFVKLNKRLEEYRKRLLFDLLIIVEEMVKKKFYING